MLKKISIIFIVSILFVLFVDIKFADAFCPVCTVAVGAGVGLSRWLKIDDLVTGLWIGALIVSMIGWTINYLDKKKIKFIGRKILITLGYYALIIIPLYYTNVIGHPYNKLWGMDKLVWGIIFGTIAFLIGYTIHKFMLKKHGNKVYFPMQKVVIPVGFLAITSVIIYFIIKK